MITIVDWNKFQHYKNRNPPWIRLYRTLLNNKEWAALSCEASKLLIELWCLAAESYGLIDIDSTALAWRLRLDSNREKHLKVDLQALEDKGFITSASNMIATCKQHATPETEGETEGETETEGEKKQKKCCSNMYPSDFLDFYKKYPLHKGKHAAFKAFSRAKRRVGVDVILAGVARLNQAIDNKAQDKEFLKHPSTWLNQGCWDDEFEKRNPQQTRGYVINSIRSDS